MKRGAILGVAAALILGACGSSAHSHSQGQAPPCAVLQNGNQLCGSALVSWCELDNNQGLSPSAASSTLQACQAAVNWSERGLGYTP